jgi:hypothetical protein
MKPPRGGPSTGPIRAGTVSQAMADTMSLLATVRSSTSRPTGTIMAPPMPWNSRAATRKPRLRDWPHRMLPRVNTMMASRKIRRAPKRSAK